MTNRIAVFGIALGSLVPFPSITGAQSGAPRNYLLGPVGVTTVFVNLTGTASETAIDSDLSLPNNVSVSRSGVATILYSFPLGDKYGGVAVTGGTATVKTTGPSADAQTTGFTDPSMTFHVNLFGGPALRPEQFASFIPVTFASFHLTVTTPLGAYDRSALINSGANRWTVSPLVNLSFTSDKGASWLELYAGGQFYSANNEYRGDNRLTQSSLVTLTGYYSHNLTPTIWAGIGVYYRSGGETFINGLSQGNSMSGFRPSAAISDKWGKLRFTLRYDGTSPTSDSSTTRSGLMSLQINFPPF
jgi:outer membrane putative beta-barrel porin/alpha-amylase